MVEALCVVQTGDMETLFVETDEGVAAPFCGTHNVR